MSATPGTVNVWPAAVAFQGKTTFPGLELGNGLDNAGIVFEVTANPPATANGRFQWVQIIGLNTSRYLTNPSTPNGTLGTGLDNWYPYVTNQGDPNSTNDSPGMSLSAHNVVAIGEGAEVFNATMYLMWDPGLLGSGQTSCTPAATIYDQQTKTVTPTASTCTGSIPIPLGYVNWGFNGDAINTLRNQPSNGTTWLLGCGALKPAVPNCQRSISYPLWTNTVHNTL